MELSKQINIINMLHDGDIIEINKTNNDIFLVIDIRYLTELINPEFKCLKIILRNCTKFSFENWDNEEGIIEDIKKIEKLEPEILDGKIKDKNYIEVYCNILSAVGGALRFKADEIDIVEIKDKVLVLSNEPNKKCKLWNLNFFLLWQGKLISSIGDSVYEIALGFWILAVTGSPGLMGTLLAASALPKIFISPVAGTVVDRHNRKWIIVLADLLRGIVITLVGVAAFRGVAKIWMVFGTGILMGICGSFFNPAVKSSIPDIVPKSELLRANSSFSMLRNVTGILGKSFGGFLFQMIGACKKIIRL